MLLSAFAGPDSKAMAHIVLESTTTDQRNTQITVIIINNQSLINFVNNSLGVNPSSPSLSERPAD